MSGLRVEGRIAITGAAGFIGYHLAERLLGEGWGVVGIDDLNDYYPVSHKVRRRDRLVAHPAMTFAHADVARADRLEEALEGPLDAIVHLAAWPGVHASADRPDAYVHANLAGFATVLEACRRRAVPLLFASSSSVYGDRPPPLAPEHPAGPPRSFYAATKAANEAMAHAYAAQHGVASTAVRFFNVYGPLGRPDMAVYRFTELIETGRPVRLHHEGRMTRDLTFVDDAVEALVRLLATPRAGCSVVNVGRGQPVTLFELVGALEEALGRPATIERVGLPAGEVVDSWADVSALVDRIGYRPTTSLEEGLARFVAWYRASRR